MPMLPSNYTKTISFISYLLNQCPREISVFKRDYILTRNFSKSTLQPWLVCSVG